MTSNSRIWLSLAQMGGGEMRYIQEAFDSNWVVPLGPNVDGFEADLAAFIGADKSVAALSSGTAALHLALVLLGVKAGDEVICQSFTFSASANPICYLGAKPVFVDSELETWNMSPAALEEAILARQAATGVLPKAIIAVDLYGMPAKWREIQAIAAQYGIPVIEDAAEALGSCYAGRACGTFGAFGILSFNGNKIITTSGGGALVCPTREEKAHTLFFATQARDPAPHYQHSHIGYNYRLSNVCAGIGRGQMEMLAAHIARRREIHQRYMDLLAGVPGVSLQQEPGEDFSSNFWLTTMLVEESVAGWSREDLRLALERADIESRPLWKPLHLQPVFAQAPYYGGDVAESLFEKGLCLPSGGGVDEAALARIATVIRGMKPVWITK